VLNNFTTCVEIVQFLFISVLCRIFVRYVKILLFEPSHLSYWVLQSANRCLADFCGALHCDYVDGLSNSKWKKTTCKPAVVDRNRHLCEVLANNCFPKEQSAAAQWLNDFFKRQFCDAHTCDKQLQPFPHGSGKHENSSLYFAICILTPFILAIIYFVVYLQYRDLSMTRISLHRLSQHTHIKMRKAKLT
jgi:hypothetical protein